MVNAVADLNRGKPVCVYSLFESFYSELRHYARDVTVCSLCEKNRLGSLKMGIMDQGLG